MTLEVHTARVSYGGPDRLDVTRKSGTQEGLCFAPSWALLRQAHPKLGGKMSWAEYEKRYTAEMRASYRANLPVWQALLGRQRVVLVCYCSDPDRCHRTVLARILGHCGALVRGEIPGVEPGPVKVYVDGLIAWGDRYKGAQAEQARRVGCRNGHRWCHMFTDEADCAELHRMARKIGLRREWFQGDHYDLTPGRRARAVELGAVELCREDAVAVWRRQREGARSLPRPAGPPREG